MQTVQHARILLVDDYRDALDMWGIYLRHCGYDVLTSDDGIAGLAMALEHLPDLIILDLDLPGMSGFELARHLRDRPSTSRIPLIALTGYSHAKLLNEAYQAGFDSVMVKPCEPAALVAEIETIRTRDPKRR